MTPDGVPRGKEGREVGTQTPAQPRTSTNGRKPSGQKELRKYKQGKGKKKKTQKACKKKGTKKKRQKKSFV